MSYVIFICQMKQQCLWKNNDFMWWIILEKRYYIDFDGKSLHGSTEKIFFGARPDFDYTLGTK